MFDAYGADGDGNGGASEFENFLLDLAAVFREIEDTASEVGSVVEYEFDAGGGGEQELVDESKSGADGSTAGGDEFGEEQRGGFWCELEFRLRRDWRDCGGGTFGRLEC